MKKTLKIFSVMLMAIIMISMVSPIFALTPSDLTGENAGTNIEDIKRIGNQVVSILTTVGIVISVVVLLILGIKYMMGSASEKAEYKKTMIPYLVGAVLIFGASSIATMVMNLAKV